MQASHNGKACGALAALAGWCAVSPDVAILLLTLALAEVHW